MKIVLTKKNKKKTNLHEIYTAPVAGKPNMKEMGNTLGGGGANKRSLNCCCKCRRKLQS